MDDQKTDVNPVAGEEASETPSSSVKPKATEEVTEPEDKVESTEETKSEGEETKTEVPKKGAEARIRELNAKANTAEEKAQSLAKQLEELTGGVPQEPTVPFTPQVQPGSELTQEQYSQDVIKTADALVQLRLSQQKVIDTINDEANQVIKVYPELDPDGTSFNKDLSDSITEATLAFVRSNPNGSVRKFVDKLMKPYKASLNKEVAEDTEETTRQIAQTAMRPTPGAKNEKKAKDKTIEELEKELGVVY